MNDLRLPIGRFEFPEDLLAELDVLIDEIESTPAELRRAVAGLDEERLDTPYRRGGWTIRQVVHHVADSHINGYTRCKLAVTGDSPAIELYEQDRWAEVDDAKAAPVEVSLALLDALHRRWVWFLRSLDEAQLQRTFRHPDQGELSVLQNVAIYAWHGRHHVAQITALRQRHSWRSAALTESPEETALPPRDSEGAESRSRSVAARSVHGLNNGFVTIAMASRTLGSHSTDPSAAKLVRLIDEAVSQGRGHLDRLMACVEGSDVEEPADQ